MEQEVLNPQPLRQQAEDLLRNTSGAGDDLPDYDMQRLLYELRVHQAELEIQNEELRHKQTALQLAHDQYATLYNFAPVGYLTLDTQGVIQKANLRASMLLGAPRGHLLGTPLSHFILRDDQDIFYLHRHQVFERPANQHCALRLQRPDGTMWMAYLESQVVHDAPGGELQCFMSLSDVPELKEAVTTRQALEAQLRQAQKMEAIGTFASGIAHDFNNILGVVLGSAELVQEELSPGHPGHKSLQRLFGATYRAKNVVQQLLAFSRQQEPVRQVIHLAPVVDEVLAWLRLSLPAMIRLQVRIAPDCPAILADATQIHQVLLNLCTNALQAMASQDGFLEITVTAPHVDAALQQQLPHLQAGPYVRLTVQDTGRGMDVETQEHIFEPFFTTKGPGEGTGLGLAVVHGIVHRHNGTIVVTSRPGEGATFDLYFPATFQEASPVVQGAASQAQGQGGHILLVDDDHDMLSIGTAMLQRLGYRVTALSGPEAALEAVREQPGAFDLVLTDLMMPIMSGTELATMLLDVYPDLRIIFMSGYEGALTQQAARALGAIELLAKPFSLTVLGESVSRALARKDIRG